MSNVIAHVLPDVGVAPPNQRNEEDFDAGAKYHVAGDVGYVRYFTAHIYEFQFYRELCLVSGEYVPNDIEKPLHRCNFYGRSWKNVYRTRLFLMAL